MICLEWNGWKHITKPKVILSLLLSERCVVVTRMFNQLLGAHWSFYNVKFLRYKTHVTQPNMQISLSSILSLFIFIYSICLEHNTRRRFVKLILCSTIAIYDKMIMYSLYICSWYSLFLDSVVSILKWKLVSKLNFVIFASSRHLLWISFDKVEFWNQFPP